MFYKYIVMVQLKCKVMSTRSLLMCYSLTLTICISLNYKVGTQSCSIHLDYDVYFHKGIQTYLKAS